MRRFHYEVIDSTSSEAQRLSLRFVGEQVLVTAQTQTQGRGRSGNAWRSPAGGLWFSLAWPCCGEPARMDATPLVVGVAVADAIQSVAGPSYAVELKWPNDVLLEGKKVAGILCERTLAADASPTRSWVLIVGVGINANVAPEALPRDLRFPAASLLDTLGEPCGADGLREMSVSSITRELGRLVRHGFGKGDAERVNARLAWRGQSVTMLRGEERIDGTLRGVDPYGRLLLDAPTGMRAVEAGEVRLARPSPRMIGPSVARPG